ncbi:glycosyltransferase family 2 protein [Candidatus Parcubacteria bacterium]|nr:MAG: glycosyltransferase family 2 protein [Candidatus Parcubacteria bacterium]
MSKSLYLKAGKAADIPSGSGRFLYRLFEIIPGALAWITIIGIFIASRFAPLGASIFIIAFDIYWLFKTIFLSIHLRLGYGKMREHMHIDWLAKLSDLPAHRYAKEIGVERWDDVWHLVIRPFYKEPYEVLHASFASLVEQRYPHEKMIVVIGVEERAGSEALAIAERITAEFKGKFFRLIVAVHPADVPGELAGKGSNETYAARRAKEEVIDPLGIPYERIMVSSLDIDTVLPPDYFAILTYHFLTAAKPHRSSYQPIPVYNNNVWETPAFARVVAVSGTFWQTMQQARPERLATFSSHSMPFKALVEMDFWNVNIVSEDSRIFWKSLMFYDGDYRTVPLYYPVYLDANVGPNVWATVKNVYKQQRRWGWGVENVPYMLYGFLQNRAIPRRRKLYYAFNQLDGFWSWGTNAFIIFFLGWLPVWLGSEAFGTTPLAYNLPRFTRWIMTASMIGMITSAIYSLRLLPPRPKGHPFRKYAWMALQWLLLPVTIIFFGSVPGLEAQTRLMLGRYMGFWVTPKFRSSSKSEIIPVHSK